jgi:hypothetical protein
LYELTASQTATRSGREIIPTRKEITALTRLVQEVLQPIRYLLDSPVIITSGLRPAWLNMLVGGSKHSQHMTGEAVDFIIPGREPIEVCRAIEKSNIPFDQLISEFGRWIHVSYCPESANCRCECLKAHVLDGKTIYTTGFDA